MTRSLSQIEVLELAISFRVPDLSVTLSPDHPTLTIETERYQLHLEFPSAAAWHRFAETIVKLREQPGYEWDRNRGGQ